MPTRIKSKAPIPEEHLEALESIRKHIRAGRLKRVTANLSEGEGVTITIRDGVRIDLIKKNGRLTAKLSDGEPPKIFVG